MDTFSDEAATKQFHLEKAISMIPVSVALCVFMLMGIFGNVMVCFYYGFKTRRTTNSLFICTLAVYDIISVGVALPMHLYDLSFLYRFQSSMICKSMLFVTRFTGFGNAFTLLFIALDRYRRICQPFKKQFTFKEAKFACAVFCLISACFSAPAFALYDAVALTVKSIQVQDCTSVRSGSFKILMPVYSSILLGLFISTVIFLIVIYSLLARYIMKKSLFRKLYCRQRQSCESIKSECGEERTPSTYKTIETLSSLTLETTLSNAEEMSNSSKQNLNNLDRKSVQFPFDTNNMKFTMLMLSISTVFIVSYLPYCILEIWRATLDGHEEDKLTTEGIVAFNFFVRSYFINSAVNPLTYGFFNSRFRQYFCEKLCPFCRKTPVTNSLISISGNEWNYSSEFISSKWATSIIS